MDSVFANLPPHYNLSVIPKSVRLLQSFGDMHKAANNLSPPTHTFPVEVEHGSALAFFFKLSYCKQASFPWPIKCHMALVFIPILLVIVLFKMPPKCSAKGLASAAKG